MRATYRILSVLMVIGGIASIIFYIFATMFSAFMNSFAGNGGWLIAYPIFALLAGIAELVAGIFGNRYVSKDRHSYLPFILGLVSIGLGAATLLIAHFPMHIPLGLYNWILSLLVPVLFTIWAIIEK